MRISPGPGSPDRQVDQLQLVGAAELGDLDGAGHGGLLKGWQRRRGYANNCRRPAAPAWHHRRHADAMKRVLQAPNLALATLWADMLGDGRHRRQRAARLRQRHCRRDPARPEPARGLGARRRQQHEQARSAAGRMAARCRTATGPARACHEIVDGPFESAGTAAPRCRRGMKLTPRLALLMTLPPLLWAGNAVVGRLMVGQVPPLTLNLLRWADHRAAAAGAGARRAAPLLADPSALALPLQRWACWVWAPSTRCNTWR
jgi:hypothetical protein